MTEKVHEALYEEKELTATIIGCAYKVYKKLGFGFLESVYEHALIIEMKKAGLKPESQKAVDVYYDNQIVGHFIADLFVEEHIIVALKSVANLSKSHEVQLVNYLTATGINIGLLINFGEEKVEIKRKIRSLK
ncbi:MAG: GxxExxY protein [Candidatus Marinimicrobia bacterium]|nr:GxxExxY protein [Candidatus Neomarinimicrobiota bacterium]